MTFAIDDQGQFIGRWIALRFEPQNTFDFEKPFFDLLSGFFQLVEILSTRSENGNTSAEWRGTP